MYDGRAVGTIDVIEKNKATVNYEYLFYSLEALNLLKQLRNSYSHLRYYAILVLSLRYQLFYQDALVNCAGKID
jgi:hypothetical protein